jgi:hypothetical protein
VYEGTGALRAARREKATMVGTLAFLAILWLVALIVFSQLITP